MGSECRLAHLALMLVCWWWWCFAVVGHGFMVVFRTTGSSAASLQFLFAFQNKWVQRGVSAMMELWAS